MSTSSETKSNSDNPTTSGETEQAEKVEVGHSKLNCQKMTVNQRGNVFDHFCCRRLFDVS